MVFAPCDRTTRGVLPQPFRGLEEAGLMALLSLSLLYWYCVHTCVEQHCVHKCVHSRRGVVIGEI